MNRRPGPASPAVRARRLSPEAAVAGLVVVAVVVAEAAVVAEPVVGVAAHAVVAAALLAMAAAEPGAPAHQWLSAVALVPLARVTAWSLPFGEQSLGARALVGGVAVLGAVAVLARADGSDWRRRLGLTRGTAWPAVVAVGAALPIGAVAALARDAGPVGGSWVLSLVGLAVLSPVADEVVFRGLLLPRARAVAGSVGPVLVALLWSTSFLGSPVAVLVLAAALGLLLGWARERSGSLAGPIAAHALVNLLVYLV